MLRKLAVAETFYSIQGEGPFTGVPAVFLRCSHCNLRCPQWGPPGAPQGCDTTQVWTRVWRRWLPEEITEYWQQRGWLKWLTAKGGTHLVLTGGEPLVWQSVLSLLLSYLKDLGVLPFIEVETNGTLLPEAAFDGAIGQYNCSPKLRSAGNPRHKAFVPEVLQWFSANERTIFKFVVQVPEDLDEIERDYVVPMGITRNRIWLMPEAATRARLIEQSGWVVDGCKERGFNFSPRLHLLIWDTATGV